MMFVFLSIKYAIGLAYLNRAVMANDTTIAELVNRLFQEHRRTDGQEFTNQEVAHELSIHPSYIGKIRAGKVPNPGRDTLKQLCLFFQVPSSYFFPELDTLEAPA